MKLIAICGSPRRAKTTQWALEQSLEAAKESTPELETELITLADKSIAGCNACGACAKKLTCTIEDDFLPLIEKLRDPGVKGLLLGSPVYFGGMTSQLKAFLDRSVAFRRNGFLFKNKIGGALALGGARNGGQELVLQGLHAAMLIHDMIIVGDASHFGGTGWAGFENGIEQDSFAVETYRQLGRKMAETIKRTAS